MILTWPAQFHRFKATYDGNLECSEENSYCSSSEYALPTGTSGRGVTPGDGACDAPRPPRTMPRALRGRLSEWMHIEQRQPQRMPRLPPRGLALSSQPEDIIQMLSGLVDVKERPNWVSNPGRFSSPPVKRHLARTWLPVPFLQPWLPPCRPNLCLCLSLSSWRDA